MDNKIQKTGISWENSRKNKGTNKNGSKNSEVEILSGHVSKDLIHILVSAPPHLSVSKLVQYIKGYSSRKLLMENKELNKQFWGQHLWQEDILQQVAAM